jgi:hypothetical protein
VWRQLQPEGIEVARCAVERLMSRMAWQGWCSVRPLLHRSCRARRPSRRPARARLVRPCPSRRWDADITSVATWSGLVSGPTSPTCSSADLSAGGYPNSLCRPHPERGGSGLLAASPGKRPPGTADPALNLCGARPVSTGPRDTSSKRRSTVPYWPMRRQVGCHAWGSGDNCHTRP